MIIGIQTLFSRNTTARQIENSAKHFRDLGFLLDTTLEQFFNFVRRIPYKMDSESWEIVARPAYLLDKNRFPALDCKKKSVLILAWLYAHGIPGRLVGISELPSKVIHHIFPQAFINGKWRNLDPTYPEFKMFEPKPNATHAVLF